MEVTQRDLERLYSYHAVFEFAFLALLLSAFNSYEPLPLEWLSKEWNSVLASFAASLFLLSLNYVYRFMRHLQWVWVLLGLAARLLLKLAPLLWLGTPL